MTGSNEGIIVSGGSLKADQVAVGRGARAEKTQIGGVETQDLRTLAKTLTALLRTAPTDKAAEATALAAQATRLVEESSARNPNRTTLQSVGRGLKQTAEFLKEALPDAAAIAGQIVTLVGKLHGIGI